LDRTIKFVWDKCKKNYYDKGIHAFWLDEAEPEFGPYAGISWWTTDIGGFLGGDPEDEEFRELMIRWFQWGAFSTVFRMHGARQPFLQLVEEFRNGVKQL
jgi:alpha-glucosidase (family GH31 glycosyl hydrolase)